MLNAMVPCLNKFKKQVLSDRRP